MVTRCFFSRVDCILYNLFEFCKRSFLIFPLTMLHCSLRFIWRKCTKKDGKNGTEELLRFADDKNHWQTTNWVICGIVFSSIKKRKNGIGDCWDSTTQTNQKRDWDLLWGWKLKKNERFATYLSFQENVYNKQLRGCGDTNNKSRPKAPEGLGEGIMGIWGLAISGLAMSALGIMGPAVSWILLGGTWGGCLMCEGRWCVYLTWSEGEGWGRGWKGGWVITRRRL